MFLKETKRCKDGKEHHYWSLVENRRVDGGKDRLHGAQRRARKCSTFAVNCAGSCRKEKWLTSGWISSPAPGIWAAMNSVFSRLIASSWSASTIQVGVVMGSSTSSIDRSEEAYRQLDAQGQLPPQFLQGWHRSSRQLPG